MIKDLCFEIIETCPNNCLFCSSCSLISETKMIDFELFKKAIDYLISKGGIEEISLSGGEPLLHPNIFEMVKYCKDRNIRVVLFTSGIVRRKYIDSMCEKLIPDYKFSGIDKKNLILLKELGLDKIEIHNGTRKKPLCKQLYKFRQTIN